MAIAAPAAAVVRRAVATAPDVAVEDDPYMEQVRQGFNRERLQLFFQEPARAIDVVSRWAEIASVGYPALRAWEDETIPAEERGVPMRSALASLGPVFVKVGQTLAERPDLVGMDGATELRKLQTQNQPFADEIAYRLILEDLGHRGPLAPDGFALPGGDPAARPLFRSFGPRVATASLGQVYRAETWEGQKVAVKVQRASVARQVVLDWQCLKSLLDVGNFLWKRTDDISLIADTAITGIMEELDYHKEAANALLFLERHREQPWITAPRFLPEYTGPKGTARVLTMEWIEGRRVGQIQDKAEQLRLVNMAVEACVSQLVGTGFVHIDPHEGNILLTDDGRIAFLDFGLMGHVPAFVMEGFAAGIQHTLSGNYLELSQVMKEVEFIPKEGFQRVHGDPLEPGEYYFTSCTKEEFAGALEKIMDQQEGGKTQFGAFFIGLLEMSKNYRLTTPPYIILFVRTFLTLEGIAAQYDPSFNIYEVGMPFAMRRALAPSTREAIQAFRSNLLTDENKIRWDTILTLLEAEEAMSAGSNASTQASPTVSIGGAAPALDAGHDAAAADPQTPAHLVVPSADDSAGGGYGEALQSLLGTPEGRTVRRVLRDIDIPAALAALAAYSEGRPLRRKAAKALAGAVLAAPGAAVRRMAQCLSLATVPGGPRPHRQEVPPAVPEGHDDGSSSADVADGAVFWQAEVDRVREKQARRWRNARRVILGRHVQQLRAEPAAVALVLVGAVKVVLRASLYVPIGLAGKLRVRLSRGWKKW
eukprot:CAMPEP_0198578060 /NCGR_PEP_ID=MMETSP1462-20131121/119718_1 /TAXON_ID=1333877 /ORGANISM="Brandtodinium nutriculum, Strain RCC3387" /LENGTH=762 /DNA_ID=CAMNT_0044309349 /DNA_START=124 /DNA_END=2413 /DNA_ORIENTATION=-